MTTITEQLKLEGKEEARREIALELLKMNLATEQIRRATKLTLEDIEELRVSVSLCNADLDENDYLKQILKLQRELNSDVKTVKLDVSVIKSDISNLAEQSTDLSTIIQKLDSLDNKLDIATATLKSARSELKLVKHKTFEERLAGFSGNYEYKEADID